MGFACMKERKTESEDTVDCNLQKMQPLNWDIPCKREAEMMGKEEAFAAEAQASDLLLSCGPSCSAVEPVKPAAPSGFKLCSRSSHVLSSCV